MTLTLDQLGNMFASKLRKQGVSPGEHDVIYLGKIWHCTFDGLRATVAMPQKIVKEKEECCE